MAAIKAENLSKIYKLYDSKKDRLREAINPFKRKYSKDFYALKDVSFTIEKGETVGIIGKNGSGKSTLLKIITGLLTPSSGNVFVNGKVAALLELGAGFNPEYTGIENVYLNATLMGFTKDEIEEKLDDIIFFADIGEFITQPVKNYSSGMYVRLAFAIAINVQPEILIIDEALAVGDIRFQQKCYRKINEFKEKNVTILFCTHDIGAILSLCSSCIWIHDGQIKGTGLPQQVTKNYRAYMFYDQRICDTEEQVKTKNIIKVESDYHWIRIEGCPYFGDGDASITHFAFFHEETGKPVDVLKCGEVLTLGIRIEICKDLNNPIIGFSVKNNNGLYVFATNTFVEEYKVSTLKANTVIECFYSFVFPPIANGVYSLDVAIAEGTQLVHRQQCWVYDITEFRVFNYGDKYSFGYVYVDNFRTHIKYINNS